MTVVLIALSGTVFLCLVTVVILKSSFSCTSFDNVWKIRWMRNCSLFVFHQACSRMAFKNYRSQNSHAMLDERVYEEDEMLFVCMRLSCGVCEYALVLKHVCMWLPVGWECRVGIFQAPCCSRNICPLCGTNQSAEPSAVTNQAAWWSFHGILGWSWNKGRHLPRSPLLPPASPHPSGFDILDPHMGKSPPPRFVIPRIMTEKWRT